MIVQSVFIAVGKEYNEYDINYVQLVTNYFTFSFLFDILLYILYFYFISVRDCVTFDSDRII